MLLMWYAYYKYPQENISNYYEKWPEQFKMKEKKIDHFEKEATEVVLISA